jgi:DNA invertase Pin-like site-specific DNA recombinase
MDRLARNLNDLRRLVQGLTRRGVRIEFIRERLTFTGEDSSMVTLLLSVMDACTGFERSLILERQREGITLAKRRGAYHGRKKVLSREQAEHLRERVAASGPKAAVARAFGTSRETLYRYVERADVPRRRMLSAPERASLLAVSATEANRVHFHLSESYLGVIRQRRGRA